MQLYYEVNKLHVIHRSGIELSKLPCKTQPFETVAN